MAGGEPGVAGHNYVLRADGSRTELGPFDQTEMAAGDVFVIETPGWRRLRRYRIEPGE